MSDRFFTTPADLLRHQSYELNSNNTQNLWHIPPSIFKPIWEMGITGKGVIIAHIDTGVNQHPLLPKPLAVRNFTNSPGGPNSVRDVNGHGTHVSGTSVGRDGIGYAPEADHIFAKVLGDSGAGSTSWINSGRIWAAKEGAHILSESLGGGGGGQADIDSIQKAFEFGISIDCAAAGNAGYNGSNTIGYPGKYEIMGCVGAYRADGRIANFSSGGREIDVACPGENIISSSAKGGLQSMSGTSMATPAFAGLMALIIHKRRITGFPDIFGIAAWKEFFKNEGFLEDAGAPGFDPRFGLGKPIITNILNWLKEPLNI